MVRTWAEVTVRIPIDIEVGDGGLTYVTSPFIRGLLVAEKTEQDALDKLPNSIEDLASAAVA